MDLAVVPGWEGSLGPFPNEYALPHVYARDIRSGAGSCVCGAGLSDPVHVQAAPGVDMPDRMLAHPLRMLGKAIKPERRFILGLAYQAGRDPRIAKGADGARDFFTADELEEACWSFLPNGGEVGLFHLDGSVGHFSTRENCIYRGPDWDQGNGLVIKRGDWLIGGICDEIAWDLVKTRRVTGFSPQGAARRHRYLPGSDR